jgi:acyl-CoA synthetase (AMP-forming)/AMP-acid ligase II
MRRTLAEHRTLWQLAARAGLAPSRIIADADGGVGLAVLAEGATLDAEALRGKCVLLSSDRQLPSVLALLQLDGTARRILLCPPDLSAAHLGEICAEAGVDVIVTDGTGPGAVAPPGVALVQAGTTLRPRVGERGEAGATEWLLFTSGTTGRPKLVLHTLASLTGPLDDGLVVADGAVWSTFYDVRRYGGLQILLRAMLGGGSMVLSQAGEAVADFLGRAGRMGVTHISGTPSHWRRALISGASAAMAPDYVRLSGEVADQAILDHLAAAYPQASVAHAFASTEAGVAFDVRDGLAGFPARLIEQYDGKAELRVVDGSLRIRSARTASRYLGDRGALVDADGFVDTGDMLELRGERYFFVGRREGIINVGGAKVHPEEVEAVLNAHPAVQMSRVWGRASPITGAIVMADVVLREPEVDVVDAILGQCRDALPAHKVPAMLRCVASLDIAQSGKLARTKAENRRA